MKWNLSLQILLLLYLWLNIDENRGRGIAKRFGLKVTGTMGTIIEAKKRGLLNNVREKLDELINAGIWIGEDLYEEALRLSGEPGRG